ncbi:MAG: DnaJ domain-containing protein [Gammaproteobacteria bacterium]|nr:DnaJ domain-containing protein [Gammaproteobacteria bacterium]
MEYKDYYKIMGLKRDASQDEIKRVYRKLARKYHPDVSKEQDAEERFKEVGEAYEVLKDPEKRAAYDQLGAGFKSGQDFHPPPNWDSGFEFSGGGFTGADTGGFSDFFEELFGRQGYAGGSSYHTSYSAQGEDHHAKVEVDLEDAFNGAVRSITLQSPELNEQGQIHLKQRTLKIKIPKGVKEGQQIRLAGQGAPGMGQGAKGDLYLEIHFKPHPLYRAERRDLYMQLPVTPWEVALGATVKTPTPGGKIDLKIPAGSNSGNRLRLKGRGIPGKQSGDIYVTLKVMTPPADSDKAKEFYKEMASQLAFNPRKDMGV